jgi:DNA mismatch repair protein MutS
MANAAPTLTAGPSEVEVALSDCNPDDLTPREALDALYRLKGLLKG